MRRKGRDFPASSATPLGVPRAILATLHFVPNTVTVPALAIRQGGLVLGWATWVGIHLPKCKRGIDFLLISFPNSYISNHKNPHSWAVSKRQGKLVFDDEAPSRRHLRLVCLLFPSKSQLMLEHGRALSQILRYSNCVIWLTCISVFQK